jgi:GAF domain-containing protein
VLNLTHPDPGFRLTREQLGLVQTFADQAVIAIENVRLFNETREALERQTATAEVLQVISSSVADTAPVFRKIIQSCEKLFKVEYVNLALIGDDGLMHMIQDWSTTTNETSRNALAWTQQQFPRPVRNSIHGYAIHKGSVLHFPDVANGPAVPKGLRASTELAGNYSALYAPMFWEGKGIGALAIHHFPPRPFTDNDINLLKAFADQAVIAIQNARLFNELQSRNRDVSEALEQQTATSEVLRVISTSRTNTQAVFDVIAQSVQRLCKAAHAGVFTYDGELIDIAALFPSDGPGASAMRAVYPAPPSRASATTRAILDRACVVVPDVRRKGDRRHHRHGGGSGLDR